MFLIGKKDNNIRYLEDILKQGNFTLEEIKNAKRRHPLLCWYKGKKFWLEDWVTRKYYRVKRKVRKFINYLL